MILLIRRKRLLIAVVCLTLIVGIGLLMRHEKNVTTLAALTDVSKDNQSHIIVIDPGHGGEDGGAVANDGTIESTINLAIAQRMNQLLRFCGRQTVMIRDSDVSIYAKGASTLHEKKVSDLKNRVAMVNGTPGAILISIHQNSMPSAPRVHGAQAFYNTKAGAEELAKIIQEGLNKTIDQGNEKTVKQIPSSIYLMKNVTSPAVLIECGFLSNSEENSNLKREDYQLRLACAMTSGILSGVCS